MREVFGVRSIFQNQALAKEGGFDDESPPFHLQLSDEGKIYVMCTRLSNWCSRIDIYYLSALARVYAF